MTRLVFVLGAIFLTGCGRERAEIAFPEAVSAGWKREGSPAEASVPSYIQTLGLHRAARANYSVLRKWRLSFTQ
jgi:hypothetical protein